MIIRRKILGKLLEAAKEYPVITIVGPRQSGKTTLAQYTFPKHAYISLEDFDMRTIATLDPRRFLTEYATETGIIIDEIQHAPALLSYMQTIVDREKKNGFFILTGSQNFLINEIITQTLAGRIAVFTLLPLSIEELSAARMLPDAVETLMYRGMYPKAHAENVSVERLYKNYIQSYVERDVRQIKQIGDLSTFQRFLLLCVGRIGQLVNLTSLANDCGITQNTVKSWLSVLEASYIIFLLYPYYKNFGKRVIKTPKLYFVDTGLACNLLNIDDAQSLQNHYLRGGLFESFLLVDIIKQQYNRDRKSSLYFWRDQRGNELDGIIDYQNMIISLEIKSGKTINQEYFKTLTFFQNLTEEKTQNSYLLYAGNDNQPWPQATVLSWKNAGTLIEKILQDNKTKV